MVAVSAGLEIATVAAGGGGAIGVMITCAWAEVGIDTVGGATGITVGGGGRGATDKGEGGIIRGCWGKSVVGGLCCCKR